MTATPKAYPVLKIFALLLCGVWLAFLIPVNAVLLLFSCLFTLVIGSLLLHFGKFLSGVHILALLLSGYFCGLRLQENTMSPSEPYPPPMDALLIGKVSAIMPFDSAYFRCVVEGVVDMRTEAPHDAKVLLSLSGTAITDKISIGTTLYCVAKLRSPQPRYITTEFSEFLYCASNNIRWIGQAYVNELALCGNEKSLWHIVENARSASDTLINSLYPAQTRGFVKALLLGDKRDIDLERRQVFALTGTAHVLAVSGLHVGIIALLIFSLSGFIVRPWLRFTLLAVCLGVFILLSGLQPSALRAGIFSLLLLGLRIFQREARMLNILAAVVCGMILLQPTLLLAAGFQMSVASILGIGLFYERFNRFLSLFNRREWRWLQRLLQSVALSLAAGTTVAPLVAWYFSLYSVVSPLANLFVIPLTTLAIFSSLLSLLAALFSVSVGEFYAQFTHTLLLFTEWINTAISTIPFASLQQNNALFFSCVASGIITYICTSRSIGLTVVRVIISACVLSTAWMFWKPVIRVESLERKKYQVQIVPVAQTKAAILMKDKQRYTLASDDYAFEQYLRLLPADTLLILAEGKASVCVVDSIECHNQGRIIGILRSSYQKQSLLPASLKGDP